MTTDTARQLSNEECNEIVRQSLPKTQPAPGFRAIVRAAYAAGRESMRRDAVEACMRATPDSEARKMIGDAAHYMACAKAIEALP